MNNIINSANKVSKTFFSNELLGQHLKPIVQNVLASVFFSELDILVLLHVIDFNIVVGWNRGELNLKE